MITLFDVLQVGGTAAGALLGYRFGSAGGVVAGAGIAVVGGAVGFIVGRVPFVLSLALFWRSVRRSSVLDLRARLDREYFVSHLIIAELVSRGEPVESFRSVVAAQLASPSKDVRAFGLANARVWFPDLVT